MQIQIPKKTPGKSGAATLQELPRIELADAVVPQNLERGLYSRTKDGLLYNFIYSPSSEKRLFVLLSGHADRKKLDPPVFQRWSWEPYFPGHSLYISDPSLHLDKALGLAWYVGTSKKYIMPSIAELIVNVAKSAGIPLDNVILYASSGGGFAALKLSALLPETTAIVINPQTDITRYKNFIVGTFLRVCFDSLTREQAIQAYPERLSVIPDVERLKNNKIVYVQNLIDTHHMEDHFQPFAKAMGLTEENSYSNDNFQTVFFSNEQGHAVGEPPELFPELVKRALALSVR